MKLGDMVKWESGAAGGNTEKRGEIVAVMRPYDSVIFSPDLFRRTRGDFTVMFDGYGKRPEESYLVLVRPVVGNSKPKLYWPRVKGLVKCSGNPL